MASLPTFKILPGLPAYGPAPHQFSLTGQGTHREGLVVAFSSGQGEEWIGNFQPGLTTFSAVAMHPNKQKIVVISGGAGYVVDPVSMAQINTFGSAITNIFELPAGDTLIFADDLSFELHDKDGVRWRTSRLSWDGMRNIQITASEIVGEGWCFDDTWHKFNVNLSTGTATGGGYTGA